jgi:glycosyltransferase involved in cell wall biosynthesis
MKISFGTRVGDFWERNGYGYATRMIMNSLTRLGYDWSENDKSADVEIWFDQPYLWDFSDGPYKIGYHPWESTQLPPGWAEIMNQCDEIWTPSPVIADWYGRYSGIKVPVYVFEHGVEPIWTPVERKKEGKFKFLHLGAEATRKGMAETRRAMFDAFGHNSDIELTFKMHSDGWKVSGWYGVHFITESLSVKELVELYQSHHAYVYPSWGEGFGLTPLQAMATGMPTITLPAWAPYAEHLNPKLSVGSELSNPPENHILINKWKMMHPGKMWKPNHDDLVDAMRYSYENYDECVRESLSHVDQIRAYYDWDRLTDEAFKNLNMRLENSSKSLALELPA